MMMNLIKKTIIATILLSTAFSCGKKEGAPDTRSRINNIYSSERYTMGDVVLFEDQEHLSQQWFWDDDELYRIDYHENAPYSENFFYDGDQIIRTTIPAYKLRNDFAYDGRRLSSIHTYRADTLIYTVKVSHDGKKLTAIDIHYEQNLSDKGYGLEMMPTMHPLRLLTGDAIAHMVADDACRLSRQRKATNNAEQDIRYEFTWKDDDVVAVDAIAASETWHATLTYDNKNNPYSQLFGYHLGHEAVWGFMMMSEHNVLTLTRPYENSNDQLFTYTYSYDGDYPSQCTLAYSYLAPHNQTFEEVSYTVVRKERYEYK